MKKILFALMTAGLLAACVAPEKNLGDVTVDGTLIEAASPCGKGEICTPGIELALLADKVYYLNNIYTDIEYEEVAGKVFSTYTLDTCILFPNSRVSIKGILFEYPDNHNGKFYRLSAREYKVLEK